MDADTLSFLAQGGLATAEETENAGREGLSSKGLNKTPKGSVSSKDDALRGAVGTTRESGSDALVPNEQHTDML